MNRLFLKKGLLDIETILSSLLILIILIAIISSSIICYNKYRLDEPNKKNIVSIYNNIINNIKSDAKQAITADTQNDSFSLFDNKSNLICKYELKDKNFVRYDKDKKISVLLEKVESLSFTTQKDVPNLLTVRIFPEDKNEIPFFTSFALRGIRK